MKHINPSGLISRFNLHNNFTARLQRKLTTDLPNHLGFLKRKLIILSKSLNAATISDSVLLQMGHENSPIEHRQMPTPILENLRARLLRGCLDVRR